MALRSTFPAAFGVALLMAPPLATVTTILLDGHSLFEQGTDPYALVIILLISSVFTLVGLIFVGLPVVYVLEKIGGGTAVAAVILVFVIFSVSTGLVGDDIERQAFLTLGLIAGIFTTVYLACGREPLAHSIDA